MKRMLITITGPSCAGKTTLMNGLIAAKPDLFATLPSVTTRPPRPGEVEGQDYHFIYEEDFYQLHDDRALAQSVAYEGIFYGTRISDLEAIFERGLIPISVVEPTGVEQFREAGQRLGFEVISVYLSDELHVLVKRWLERAAQDEPKRHGFLSRRIIATVTTEWKWVHGLDYDLYLVNEPKRMPELVYGLCRVASEQTSIDMARRVFRLPRQAGRPAA